MRSTVAFAIIAIASARRVAVKTHKLGDDRMADFAFDTYDTGLALENAWLSMAAYCGHPTLPDGQALRAWECGPACDGVLGVLDVRAIRTEELDNSFAFAAKKQDKCVVGFRGTSNIAGWIVGDAASAQLVDMNEWGVECHYEGVPCMAGRGFMINYRNIQDELLGNLTDVGCKDMPISVTGHSLGGALGYIAMIDLASRGFQVMESYTFGSPRPGNAQFRSAFQKAFSNATVYRVTNCEDPVPHLPMWWLGFAHVGTEIYYHCEDPTSWRVCDDTEREDPMGSQQWALATAVDNCTSDIDNCDHSTYFKNQMHMNMGGGNCHDTKATCGGTARGKRCMFPFDYKNHTYDTCTAAYWSVPWCYTDAEGYWGECDCPQ